MNLTDYKSDEELKKTGVWRKFGDAELLIASTDSPRYRKTQLRVAKSKPPAKLRKDAETLHDVTVEVMAEGLLLDWKNVNDGKKALEPTLENKIRVLNLIPDLRDFISNEAQDLTNFTQGAIDADVADLKSGD